MAKGELKKLIRRDYIVSNLSYNELANKYNVSKSTIFNWAKSEGWRTEKDRYLQGVADIEQGKSNTKLIQFSDDFEKVEERLHKSADLLLDKINGLLELEDALAPRDLKSISSTLMDLKMLWDIKPEENAEDSAEKYMITIQGGSVPDA